MVPSILLCFPEPEADRARTLARDLLGRVPAPWDVVLLDEATGLPGRESEPEVVRRAVGEAVERGVEVVALISSDWLQRIEARAATGGADVLRLALERAFALERPVVPVLLEGARLPEDLPATLGPLARLEPVVDRDPGETVDRLLAVLAGAWVLPPEGDATGSAPPEVLADAGAPVPGGEAADRTSPRPAPDGGDADGNLAYDEDVQFTVYRPAALRAGSWETLLAFAHLGEAREAGGPDPLDEVRLQAKAVLGEELEDFRTLVADTSVAIPREGEITFVPRVEGVEFNPPSRSFLWQEDVHREAFRMRAAPALAGTTARGTFTVFLGAVLLAEMALNLKVTDPAAREPALDAGSVSPYRRVFPSYSHLDRPIVDQFRRHAEAMGDEYLQDALALRSGEVGSGRILRLIEAADVFQLFWSWNALGSRYVEQEWRHALALGRERFVRPCYWQQPLPEKAGMPPPELSRLHFHFMGWAGPEAGDGAVAPRPPAETGKKATAKKTAKRKAKKKLARMRVAAKKRARSRGAVSADRQPAPAPPSPADVFASAPASASPEETPRSRSALPLVVALVLLGLLLALGLLVL